MINSKGKKAIVDMSNFTLGAKITVIDNNTILLKSTIEDMSNIESQVIDIVSHFDVEEIYLKPITSKENDEIINSFKKALIKDFSEKVDKIQFYMI